MMSSARPLLPLLSGVAYLSLAPPFVSGSFFAALFGSNAQREYDVLTRRFGNQVTVGFFRAFDTFFNYVTQQDESSKSFASVGSMTGPSTPQPDPAVAMPAFVEALYHAGTDESGAFQTNTLLDRLVTASVRTRAFAALDRAHGAGSAQSFAHVFAAVIADARTDLR